MPAPSWNRIKNGIFRSFEYRAPRRRILGYIHVMFHHFARRAQIITVQIRFVILILLDDLQKYADGSIKTLSAAGNRRNSNQLLAPIKIRARIAERNNYGWSAGNFVSLPIGLLLCGRRRRRRRDNGRWRNDGDGLRGHVGKWG